MAMRSLATRMSASALGRRPGPGMPPAAPPRFVDTIHGQIGHATRKFSSIDEEQAQAIIESAMKKERATRNLKTYSRILKFIKWTLNLGISATAGALVVGRASRA